MSTREPNKVELVRCNLCGADQTTVLCEAARWQQRMTNVACRRCGLVYANPRLAREPLDRFYRELVYSEFVDASGHFTSRLLDSSRAQALETFQYFSRRAEVTFEGRQLLEIGCGLGDFLILAREAGASVLGVEMDGLYAEQAQRARLPLVRDHIEAIALDRVYDVIALFHVLEHLADPKATLASLRSRLAPEGRLLIEVPDLMGSWRITPAEFFRIEHLYNFSFQTLEAMLSNGGYRVVARDSDPFVLRIIAAPSAAGEHVATPDLSRHHDELMRHMFRWRVRSRAFQPYYALRRLVAPDARRR